MDSALFLYGAVGALIGILGFLTLPLIFRSKSRQLPPEVGRCTGTPHFDFVVSFQQGGRPYMEDRWLVDARVVDGVKTTVYGVFDGHGGSRASEFCIRRMGSAVFDALHDGATESALTKGFLETDKDFLTIAQREDLMDGTTACVALVSGNRISVGNAGDSRAVVVQKDGAVVALSDDHKPNRPDEKRRIEAAGGVVVHLGVWRTQGVLAVSRAIGDRVLKRFVSAVPEVKHFEVKKGRDAYLVLATDGVWDVVDNNELSQIFSATRSAQRAADLLVEIAIRKRSRDNICVLAVDLRNQRVVTGKAPK